MSSISEIHVSRVAELRSFSFWLYMFVNWCDYMRLLLANIFEYSKNLKQWRVPAKTWVLCNCAIFTRNSIHNCAPELLKNGRGCLCQNKAISAYAEFA
jgi:hypothetical protein